MTHFQKSLIPAINHNLSRGLKSIEVKKTCARCGKGFCKRKGRAKAALVLDMPGRYICGQCLQVKQRQGDQVYSQ